ncbi:MAG: V/A-type H+/Na+-transporting ATPase subunit [Petroclostridium sp.]|jgi:V/A-type H+-transporting ATPase subunit A|nr:V/A-type H+/Na+-transporting ATPase subunit [Petroclostridium sp.]
MEAEAKGTIYGINGPVVKVKGSKDFRMLEMVMVGKEKLIGEVIAIHDDMTIIQVYEVTTGLFPGEPVISTGKPLSVQLGPGIIGNIFDGIERPLHYIEKKSGAFISRGLEMEALDPRKKWDTHITVKAGDAISGGSIIAEVQETPLILHRIMVPPTIKGKIIETVTDGSYSIHQPVVKIREDSGAIRELTLIQEWPIRTPRAYLKRIGIDRPLVTGQRVIDTLFPIAKGGTAAIPGGFGTGKTMTQHQLAKWSDADIIVYIGCGERGNEMTEVLEDFPKLVDPKSGRPLMDRTVLIANTSNMPVAAREASIYTGITLAEYYRDMGYHVAIMADSTSRWAEALREISGRLEEMPAEEGFPAYLPSRLSEFYERAGYVQNLNGTEGSVTIIGAVSPQGGDFSEPVTQNTKRFIRCFWALDRQLAYSRHYPAIHWLTSYSEYIDLLKDWYEKNVDGKFFELRTEIMRLLQEESKLMEIVKLIGGDILPDEQKLILDISRVIRLGFLQQNAYHASDTYVPVTKQFKMMEAILYLYSKAKELIAQNIPMSVLRNTGIFEEIIKIKYTVGNEEFEKFEEVKKKIDEFYHRLRERYKY